MGLIVLSGLLKHKVENIHIYLLGDLLFTILKKNDDIYNIDQQR